MIALLDAVELRRKSVVVRHSPATGEVVSRETAHDMEDCRRFMARAAAAFPGWSNRPPSERAGFLKRVAAVILRMKEEFCCALIEEIGAPLSWAEYNVEFSARLLRSVADGHGLIDRPVIFEDADDFQSRAERVPCGVCLAIAPWNAPLVLGVRAFAAPILCGNTVLLKGNEIAPRTFRLLGEAVSEAGLPADVLQVFLCPAEESERIVEFLIENPVVRRISFTGSTRVGRRIALICAQHLKRPVLELSGQAPMIVLDDTDLELAARLAVHGAYTNQGQICMSTERLIVFEAVADDLIRRIDGRRKALVMGDPAAGAVDLGPVIDVAAAERLAGLVSDAVSKGARLVGGGGIRGAFFEPTLIDGLEPEMRLHREEAFGPILSITRVRSDLEAVTVANDSEYGLSAAVISNDLDRAEAVARGIHSGICHVNRSTVGDDPRAPFGGVKASGYGRLGLTWALDEFTELRWITRQAHR